MRTRPTLAAQVLIGLLVVLFGAWVSLRIAYPLLVRGWLPF